MPTPSLLIVPARFKSGKLYSQVPTSGTGDFTVTRATSATRVNASGLIESVASGIPRLDYFASGGVVGCPALLVEPSAQNLCLQSTDTITSWSLGANLTSGAIDVIGVSGINLTVAVSGSDIGSAAGSNRITSVNATLTSGSTYTISFLMKKTGTHTIGGFFANTSGATNTAFGSAFDVSGSFSSGSINASSPITNRIRRVEQWGTDVYRCSETFTMTATNVLTTFRLGPTTSVTSVNNSAVGTSMGFAAPQLELGSVPTSFIPTTTAAVTRNADVVSVSGAVSGSIGQTEGTVYVEVDVKQLVGAVAKTFIDIGVASNRIFIGFTSLASNTIRLQVDTSGGSLRADIRSVVSSAGIIKIAAAYKSADCSLYVNGVSGTVSSNIAFTLSTLSNISLGKTLSDTAFLNDRIRAVALYTTRLTNDQLAFITQP